MSEMLAVQGQFERIIRLETSLEHAYAYFTDFGYVLPRLPEISRILRYRDGRYRMIFMADDGRGHEMGIVFDIQHELEPGRHIKMVAVPLALEQLRKDQLNGSNSPLFPGLFNGEVLFAQHPGAIEVVYRVKLNIEIEVPRFLALMPKNVLQRIGDGLMRMKLHQVADGFANRVTVDFKEWVAPRLREAVAVGKAQGEVQLQSQAKIEVKSAIILPATSKEPIPPLILAVEPPTEGPNMNLN